MLICPACALYFFFFICFSLKAPLVDSSDSGHSATAVIMLVSVVLMGLAVFVIYKFKRYSTLDIIYFGLLRCRWLCQIDVIVFVRSRNDPVWSRRHYLQARISLLTP